MAPGRIVRVDYEYIRKGTANIFCIVEPLTGRRLTHATARRTNRDFARALHRIAKAYPRAKRIHLVVDNLSTHTEKACIDMFGAAGGAALWRRFKVHYTPKHASGLNAAEMEASLVARQCLGNKRIPDRETLQREVRAWREAARLITAATSAGSSASSMRGGHSATTRSLSRGQSTRPPAPAIASR